MSEPISAARYWVLRGSFGDASVAWASVPVLHQGGPIDGRLVGDPGAFTIGLPAAIGAAPERTTVAVEIDNADGALDIWVVGAERTEQEYTQPSFLTFEGQVFRGEIAPDGTCTEEAFTPILAASGAVTVDRAKGTISFSLSHVDRPMLGAIGKLYSVREVVAPVPALMTCIYPDLVNRMGDAGISGLWTYLTRGDSDALDTVVPWLYGPVTTPLIRVTPEGHYPAAFIAGMSWDKVAVDGPLDYDAAIVAKIRSDYSERQRKLSEPIPFVACVELEAPGGGTRFAWLALAVQADKPGDEAKADQYWWSSTWINGLDASTDFAVAPRASPARVLREIIVDHSEAGAACIHEPSWDAAEEQQATAYARACAGRIESETTISDLVEHISPLAGMGLWVGTDGLLHVSTGGWGWLDKEAAKGSLPELIEPDIFPLDDDGTAAWTEAVPSDPDDRGAVLTKVSPKWSEMQRELFPLATAMGVAPRRVPLPIDSEWEPEAAWINPRNPGPVVRAMASRGAYPTRRVHPVSHASVAKLGPGAMLRLSHLWGVTAEPPYERRLVRLERGEVQPAEHAAALTLEDLGPSERMRLGLLDTITQWVRYDPTGVGHSIELQSETSLILSPDGVFVSDMLGCTIWVTGAADPENNRSYEITRVDSSGKVLVSPAPASDEMIVATSAAPIDAAWIIMHTDRSTVGRHREDYIRGSHLLDGALDDDRRGFQFGG